MATAKQAGALPARYAFNFRFGEGMGNNTFTSIFGIGISTAGLFNMPMNLRHSGARKRRLDRIAEQEAERQRRAADSGVPESSPAPQTTEITPAGNLAAESDAAEDDAADIPIVKNCVPERPAAEDDTVESNTPETSAWRTSEAQPSETSSVLAFGAEDAAAVSEPAETLTTEEITARLTAVFKTDVRPDAAERGLVSDLQGLRRLPPPPPGTVHLSQTEKDPVLGQQFMQIRHRPYGLSNGVPLDGRRAWDGDIALPEVPQHEPIPNMFKDPTPPHERDVSPNPLACFEPEPIPEEVTKLAYIINNLPRNRIGRTKGFDFPSRHTLKNDARLRGEISRKTGCLIIESRGGKLRKWVDDARLFSVQMWEYLTNEKYLSLQEAGSETRPIEVDQRLSAELMTEDGRSIPSAKRQRTNSGSSKSKRKRSEGSQQRLKVKQAKKPPPANHTPTSQGPPSPSNIRAIVIPQSPQEEGRRDTVVARSQSDANTFTPGVNSSRTTSSAFVPGDDVDFDFSGALADYAAAARPRATASRPPATAVRRSATAVKPPTGASDAPTTATTPSVPASGPPATVSERSTLPIRAPAPPTMACQTCGGPMGFCRCVDY